MKSGFRDYYKCTFVFEEVFERYYSRGYYGKIDKETIKESEKSWFDRFTRLLFNKNEELLKEILCNYENKISREYFGGITDIDIKYKTKEYIIEVLNKYLKD